MTTTYITEEDIINSSLAHTDPIMIQSGVTVQDGIFFYNAADLNAFINQMVDKKFQEALDKLDVQDVLDTPSTLKTVPVNAPEGAAQGLAAGLIYSLTGVQHNHGLNLSADARHEGYTVPLWVQDKLNEEASKIPECDAYSSEFIAELVYEAMVENYKCPKAVNSIDAIRVGMAAYEYCKKHTTGTTNWAYAMTHYYAKFFNAIDPS